jgi:hypothetical protein
MLNGSASRSGRPRLFSDVHAVGCIAQFGGAAGLGACALPGAERIVQEPGWWLIRDRSRHLYGSNVLLLVKWVTQFRVVADRISRHGTRPGHGVRGPCIRVSKARSSGVMSFTASADSSIGQIVTNVRHLTSKIRSGAKAVRVLSILVLSGILGGVRPVPAPYDRLIHDPVTEAYLTREEAASANEERELNCPG